MREVYRSLRVEQGEVAATLLNEAGIETSIQNGRSYKGGRRRNFSFRETPEAEMVKGKIETHLAGIIDSDKPTATM